MEKHITLVAALHIGLGILGTLTALIVFIAVTGGGLLSEDPQAIMITSLVGTCVCCFLLIISLPGIIGGIGLLKRASWARILMLIVAVMDLIHVPHGTILGVYTLWVLIQDETVRLLRPETGTQTVEGR